MNNRLGLALEILVLLQIGTSLILKEHRQGQATESPDLQESATGEAAEVLWTTTEDTVHGKVSNRTGGM